MNQSLLRLFSVIIRAIYFWNSVSIFWNILYNTDSTHEKKRNGKGGKEERTFPMCSRSNVFLLFRIKPHIPCWLTVPVLRDQSARLLSCRYLISNDPTSVKGSTIDVVIRANTYVLQCYALCVWTTTEPWFLASRRPEIVRTA